MKVLISAYACEPGAGSEPGAGWAWSRAAALDHDVWVLTRANNAGPIEKALADEPDLRYTPVYLDLPPWARFWKKWPMGVQVYYLLWQFLAWRAAKRLHEEIGFDVAHHLTFAVDWMPAGVGFVRGLPFVWGPVGGATGTPWCLWRWLGWRGILSEAVRGATTSVLRRAFGDTMARRASVVVALNDDVAQRFAPARPLVEPNAALDLEARPPSRVVSKRALFVGRLIPWKGAAIAVAALRAAGASDWELHVYGEGPERRRLERLAERLRVADRVRFQGHRPRSEVISALASSHALVFPSMHDSAGWVVAEAIAVGCPVVCLDRGGPPVIARGSGCVVQENPAVVSDVARAMGEATRLVPSSRWSERRLPAFLGHVFNLASEPRAEAMARAHD